MAVIVQGKQRAEEIYRAIREQVAVREHRPTLALVVTGDNPVTERFIRIKRRIAADIGVHVEEHRFTDAITTDVLLAKVEDLSLDESVDAIVVQLPLPEQIERASILNAIAPHKDADVLSVEAWTRFLAGKTKIVPPVLGAVKEVLRMGGVALSGKRVAVVGHGELVGKPIAEWLRRQEGVEVTVLSRGDDVARATCRADIVVLGAGVPGLLRPDMIKPGAVIIDAGTAEVSGRLEGDADPACAQRASLYTPVPGGIGPLTVAVLFRNVLACVQERNG